MKKPIIAFDVDHTLDISDGPIPIQSLRLLHENGYPIGICGNWAKLVSCCPDWFQFISFIGPMEMTKAAFLTLIRTYIPGHSNSIMVGNDPEFYGESADREAADLANWQFIRERDFHKFPNLEADFSGYDSQEIS